MSVYFSLKIVSLLVVASSCTRKEHNGNPVFEKAFKNVNHQMMDQVVQLGHRNRTSTKCTTLTEEIGIKSTLNLEAYKMLAKKPINRNDLIKVLRKRLPEVCRESIRTCAMSKYRTIDGTCNNEQHPFWGASFTPFNRLVPSAYDDGFSEPRGGRNSSLPNARLVSSTVHYDQITADAVITNMVGQFGQFLDHDISLTPEADRRCCTTEEGQLDCWPIRIPETDSFYKPRNQSCLAFTRSTPFCFPSASTPLERQQFNVLTAYVDASNVYGSEEKTGQRLRSFENGRLRTNLEFPFLLPTVEEVKNATGEQFEYMGTFYAGDERVNEMPALAVLHTLFVREHNRVADLYKEKFPFLIDAKIFEETRRIVIAEMQNIVYGEYLPVILGPDTMTKFNLTLDNRQGKYFSTYNDSIDATVVHSFSTAAYRFGHTLINGIIRLVKDLQQIGQYRLRDNFFKPHQIFGPAGNGDGYNYILEGLTTQAAQKYDNFVTEDLGRFLLKEDTNDFGQDLLARNLQRGRDHGIPPYNDFRVFCGYPPLPSTFDKTPKWPYFTNGTWLQFQQLYKSPMEIDLFTGGLTEERNPGAMTGPTFNCIKAIQFHRLKFGDRYFFTHDKTTGSFTEAEIAHLRRRKFSDIICENSRLREVPIDVFSLIPEIPTTTTNK